VGEMNDPSEVLDALFDCLNAVPGGLHVLM
jgi:hypothetical protein